MLAVLLSVVPACADGEDAALRHAGPFAAGSPGTGTSAGPVVGLAVLTTRTRLAVGDTLRLTATPRDSLERAVRGRTITWRSDQPLIVAVDGNGLARAVGPGTAVITVETSDARAWLALTVDRPVPHVVLRPGDDLQAAVDRSPAGTTFRLTPGVYRRQSVAPKDGMAFFGDPGAVLDGERVTDYAFRSDRGDPLPRNVLLRGLEIRNYVPELQMGAVRADGGGGWTIEACDVHDNATGGIRIGDRTRVLRSRVHHNGRIGILGGGDDVRIEDNEIAYNNAGARYDMYDEAGGTKFTRTRDLVVRGNWVHHNHGPGLWTDIDNVRTLYERNRVEDNAEAGIFHEISYAAVIRDNVARRNGTHAVPADWVTGSGILVGVSRDVEVVGNLVEDNRNGITAIQRTDRGAGTLGPYVLANLRVHGNTVVMRTGGVTGVATGGWQRLVDRATYASRGNRFWGNRYAFAPGARPFQWRNGRSSAEEWRAFGQDTRGVFTR